MLRVFSLFVLLLVSVPAQAAISISIGAPGLTVVDTGTAGPSKTFDFFISQDGAGSATLAASSIDFILEAGTIVDGVIGDPNSVGPGTYFGEGNFFSSDLVINDDFKGFFVDQEYFDPQLLAVDPSADLWFTVTFDTTGLAAGLYQIEVFDPADSFFDENFDTVNSNNNLFFRVSAVPEPSSLALIAFLGGGAVALRRRRKQSLA